MQGIRPAAPMYGVISPTQPQTPPRTTVRRPGRPRRQVALAAPVVNPIIGSEHSEALRALSSLLVETTTASGSRCDGSAALSGTDRILDALSSTGDRMPSRATAQRRSAA